MIFLSRWWVDNGGTEGQILVSGSFTDELGNSETFPTRKEYDQRGPIDDKNTTMLAVFRNLHRARRAAERDRGSHQRRGGRLRSPIADR